jgi:hypothetical protein
MEKIKDIYMPNKKLMILKKILKVANMKKF